MAEEMGRLKPRGRLKPMGRLKPKPAESRWPRENLRCQVKRFR